VALHAKDESLTRRLQPFHQHPTRRLSERRGVKSRSQPLGRHRLVVIAVDGEWRAHITEDLRETRPLLHVEWVRQRWHCGIRCANLPFNMLQQAAAAMHIQ
jgi:hypothetical protein